MICIGEKVTRFVKVACPLLAYFDTYDAGLFTKFKPKHTKQSWCPQVGFLKSWVDPLENYFPFKQFKKQNKNKNKIKFWVYFHYLKKKKKNTHLNKVKYIFDHYC